jgi:UDP-N-acetylmuramyl-tripeptide synthetase
MFGLFNAYNITMAFLICKSLGLPELVIKESLSFFVGVPGRLQIHILKNGARAFVDYAHNPSSFQEVLKTLRNMSNHLIVVFGCGGDRDTTKRPVMGQLAAQYADKVIVTDDNPRSEPHEKIAQEIIAGIPEERRSMVICQLDRRKAIGNAVQLSDKDSVIAILGKGHEQYFITNGKTIYFDDLEEIRRY